MTDFISPAGWAISGGAAVALTSSLIRWALKNFGGLKVDQSAQSGEVQIHRQYKALIDEQRTEIEHLGGRVAELRQRLDTMERSLDDCEKRHSERDRRDRQLTWDIEEMNKKLQQHGIT